MCELLGITSERTYDANSLLNVFYAHSQTHKDGWGLSVFCGRGGTMEKEPVKALDSSYLRQRLSRGVCGLNMFAHIRYATIGHTEYVNCHPFIGSDDSGRTWTLMHNGTIFEPGRTNDYRTKQGGSTDSERLLLYIIDRSNELISENGMGYMEAPENRFRLMDEIITEMSAGNKLNLMVYDSEYMYVHTNSPGTLHQARREGTQFFATSPVYIDELRGVEWEQIPLNQLHVYKNGQHVWSGTVHGNGFDESRYDLLTLYSAFSAL